jgi:hypothetical protein
MRYEQNRHLHRAIAIQKDAILQEDLSGSARHLLVSSTHLLLKSKLGWIEVEDERRRTFPIAFEDLWNGSITHSRRDLAVQTNLACPPSEIVRGHQSSPDDHPSIRGTE